MKRRPSTASLAEASCHKKNVSEATYAKGHCKTTLNQWVNNSNEMTSSRGKELLAQYNSFSGELQAAFAKKLLASKASKDFSWARTFKQEFERSDQQEGGCSENYFTRPQILQLKGMDMKHFGSEEEALKVADEIIADQRATIDCKEALEANPDKISEVNAVANQYWFANNHGKTSSWKVKNQRNITLTTQLNNKHIADISHEGNGQRLLEEVLGAKATLAIGNGKATIKSEFPTLAEIDKAVETLESPYWIQKRKKERSCCLSRCWPSCNHHIYIYI